MKKTIINSIASWVPLALAIGIIYATIYLAVQQYIRLSANEPLIQYAIDVRNKLSAGATPEQALSSFPVIDLQNSQSLFIDIYDNNGKGSAATGLLHNAIPVIPNGVFTSAKEKGENRITWQPQSDVRNAIVVLPYKTAGNEGYIVAGKSLWEAEARERMVLWQTAGGLVLTLVASFIATLLCQFVKSRFAIT